MIAIVNEGDGKDLCTYRLQINYKILCRFKHRRSEGLAQCLREAAKAVENYMERDTMEILMEMFGDSDDRT